jgi:hypothetical protein
MTPVKNKSEEELWKEFEAIDPRFGAYVDFDTHARDDDYVVDGHLTARQVHILSEILKLRSK